MENAFSETLFSLTGAVVPATFDDSFFVELRVRGGVEGVGYRDAELDIASENSFDVGHFQFSFVCSTGGIYK